MCAFFLHAEYVIYKNMPIRSPERRRQQIRPAAKTTAGNKNNYLYLTTKSYAGCIVRDAVFGLQIEIDFDFRERGQMEHNHRPEVAIVPANAKRHDPAVQLAMQFITVL